MLCKKVLSTALFAGLSLGVMAQQEPGQAVAPEAEVNTQQTIAEEKDVQTMIDEFLSSKGWSEGENTKKNGEKFYIAIGRGVVQAPRSDRNFAASRVATYNKAMLDAKKNMAEYLEVSIKTETEKTYSEGTFPPPPSANPQKTDESSTLGKIRQLIHAKLDKALREEGIDPDKASKEELAKAAKKQLSQESYSKFISTAAQAYVCGLQVCNSFEFTPANRKGEIGVIAIWSPKLQKMAEVMLVGGTVPNGIPKKPIVQQIPSDPVVLLTTFGVQQKLDENGNLVLVSFGQEGAISSSATAANAASRKAQLNAFAGIREFAGENVAVGSDMLNAETTTEFENAAEEYNNASAFREKIQATAAKMNISGISTVKRWKAKHPVSGKYIYGVICAWSPAFAAHAQNLKARMKAAPKATPTVNQSLNQGTPRANESQLQQRSFQGTGAAADDDAF